MNHHQPDLAGSAGPRWPVPHVGVAVALATAAGTLVALWFFPIVVCAIWTVMVGRAMIGARPMSAVTVS